MHSKVSKIYSTLFDNTFKEANFIIIEAREDNKSYEGLIPIIDELINLGFKKNHRLVAIGGCIIQDITAFIASIIYRGVDWVFFPTTLLAQGDSCIEVKPLLISKILKIRLAIFILLKIFLFAQSFWIR